MIAFKYNTRTIVLQAEAFLFDKRKPDVEINIAISNEIYIGDLRKNLTENRIVKKIDYHIWTHCEDSTMCNSDEALYEVLSLIYKKRHERSKMLINFYGVDNIDGVFDSFLEGIKIMLESKNDRYIDI